MERACVCIFAICYLPLTMYIVLVYFGGPCITNPAGSCYFPIRGETLALYLCWSHSILKFSSIDFGYSFKIFEKSRFFLCSIHAYILHFQSYEINRNKFLVLLFGTCFPNKLIEYKFYFPKMI